MNDLFNAAGISNTYKGELKVRFTRDLVRRVKQCNNAGTRLDYIELPNPMTKVEALKYLQNHPRFQSEDDQATIEDALASREKTVKVRGTKSALLGRKDTTVTDILTAVA